MSAGIKTYAINEQVVRFLGYTEGNKLVHLKCVQEVEGPRSLKGEVGGNSSSSHLQEQVGTGDGSGRWCVSFHATCK